MYATNPTDVVAPSDIPQSFLSATSKGTEMAKVTLTERLSTIDPKMNRTVLMTEHND